MNVDTNSRARLILLSLCVMQLIWAVGFGLGRILVKEGVTSTGIMLVSNGLTAIVAALLFYSYSYMVGSNERERDRLLQERLNTIDQMNHHIRNALQVIKFEASFEEYEDSVEHIHSSVGRIEWALREVLPQYAPLPNPHPSGERQEDQGNLA